MIIDGRGGRAAVESLVVDDRRAMLRARGLHARHLRDSGWSVEALAVYFNASPRTIERWIKAAGGSR